MLTQVDAQNDLSYPGMKSSCSAMFDINQVSNNSPVCLENEIVKDDDIGEGQFIQSISCQKKNPEDDIGLRFDSHNRRSFAQNALFKSESKLLPQDTGYGSEEDCYSESGEFDQGFSHESSMNFSSDMSSLHQSTPMMTGKSVTSSFVPPIIEDITNEDISDNDQSSGNHDDYDMFFSCADWET
jgi:hypothetical protein